MILYAVSVYVIFQPHLVHTDFEKWIMFSWIIFTSSIFWFLSSYVLIVMSTFLLVLFALVSWIQEVYFRAFSQYGRLSTLLSTNQELLNSLDSAKEFLDQSDYRYVWIILFYALSSTIFVNILSIKKLRKPFISLLGFSISLTFVFVNIYKSEEYLKDAKASEDAFTYYKTVDYIYETVPSTVSFVDHFGVLSLLQKDIFDMFIEPITENVSGENLEIQEMLSSKISSDPSEYFGLLEGKSVLMIEAESLIQAAINPILTPTLYRLQTNGYNFVNYNSPLLAGSTSDTELMVNTSLLPVNTGENTFMNYADQDYPVSLAKVFTENGYVSMAAHNNYAEFYNRDEFLPNLGFDFYDSYRMGFEGQMIPDSEFIVPIKWISYERENFFSYWITFNGHQPYTVDEMSYLFLSSFERVSELYPNLPEAERVYLAKTMDLDRALESLIIDFENGGRIEDLVIIIFGDHYSKGAFNSESATEMVCDLGQSECISTPFIIWNNDSFVGINEKIANPLDVLPTVFELMGFEYNQNLVLGNSVFNEDYQGFNFNDFGDLIFEEGKYNYITQEWTASMDIDFSSVEEKIENTIKIMDLGSLIIENNYFNSEYFKDEVLK